MVWRKDDKDDDTPVTPPAGPSTADQPTTTVTVEAMQDHTYNGEPKETGDTYEVPESLVDTLRQQGKALPVEDAKTRREQLEAAEKEQAEKSGSDKPRLRTDKKS